jgi:hypothetical protein
MALTAATTGVHLDTSFGHNATFLSVFRRTVNINRHLKGASILVVYSRIRFSTYYQAQLACQ